MTPEAVSLDALGRAAAEDPGDAACTGRWTRAVIDAIPGDGRAVADHLMSMVGRLPGSKIETVVAHQLDLGRDGVARRLLGLLADAPRSSPVVLLQHNIALRLGEHELAERLGEEVSRHRFADEQVATAMAARRALAAYRPERAVAVLGEVANDHVQHTNLLLTALRGVGRHDRVLEVLDATQIPPTPLLTMYRYDALLAVGELDAAARLAQSLGVDDVGQAPTFAVRLHHTQRSEPARRQLVADARALEARVGPTAAVLHAYVELGLFDDMSRIEAAAADRDPASTVHLARMHYCRGRFDHAMRLLDTLSGVDDRWDAEMLRLRVMIETGRSGEAVERQWPRTGTVHTQLDDAIYHALLREHRLDEAFAIASPWREKQFVALFGERAGDGAHLRRVRSRFVMSQSGPGDELISASVYRDLEPLSDELVITCDPRLETVLARSFPGIGFLPVQRLRPRSESFLGPGRPPRAENSQHEELTAAAMERALACDEVVLSRLLQHLALARRRRRPARPYLVPDPQLAAEAATLLPRTGPTVGIVWRSELRSPMRNIHYLDVEALAPLLAEDATFVSLQYDADEDERSALERMTGGRVLFPDDVDLRNDFEAALALSSGLSAVVGVGTTGLELAAAGGVPTVLLATNHLIAWRATGADGQDFWHESVRLAVCDDLWNREQLVHAGTQALRRVLRGEPRGSARWRRLLPRAR